MVGFDDKLTLNMAHMHHKTYITILQAFPGTCLYKLTEPPLPGTPAAQGPPVQDLFFNQKS